MHTNTVMLRNRPDAFIHSMVNAATVRPFWTTLMEMKQARLRIARLVSAPLPVPAPRETPVIATPQAA